MSPVPPNSMAVTPDAIREELSRLYTRGKTPDQLTQDKPAREKLLQELEKDPRPLLDLPDSFFGERSAKLRKQPSATYSSKVPLGSNARSMPAWDATPRSKFRSSSSFDYQAPTDPINDTGRSSQASPQRFRSNRNASKVFLGGFKASDSSTMYRSDFQPWKPSLGKGERINDMNFKSQISFGSPEPVDSEAHHFLTSSGSFFTSPTSLRTSSGTYAVPKRVHKERNASQVPFMRSQTYHSVSPSKHASRRLAKETFTTTSQTVNKKVERAVRAGYKSDYAENKMTYASKEKFRSDTMVSNESPDWFRIPAVQIRERPKTPKITEEEDRIMEEIDKIRRRERLLQRDLNAVRKEKAEKQKIFSSLQQRS